MAENELPTSPNDVDKPAEQVMPPDDTAPQELAAQHLEPEQKKVAAQEGYAEGASVEEGPAPALEQSVDEPSEPSAAPSVAKAVEEEEAPEPDADAIPKDWYILKVQVNRENSIRDALQRRVKIEGLENYFGDIIVPTEDVAEFDKNGKKKIVKRKLYPGYLVAHMAITEETWFVVRETPGIGDFTGAAGKPSPMSPHEVQRILAVSRPDENAAAAKTAIPFKVGDKVRVKEGYFQNFEGEVDSIDEANGRVTVMINIFGRSTPVELEHWQVEEV